MFKSILIFFKSHSDYERISRKEFLIKIRVSAQYSDIINLLRWKIKQKQINA